MKVINYSGVRRYVHSQGMRISDDALSKLNELVKDILNYISQDTQEIGKKVITSGVVPLTIRYKRGEE